MATSRGRGIGFFPGGARAAEAARKRAEQQAEDAKILEQVALLEESESLQKERKILIERGKKFYPNFTKEFEQLDKISLMVNGASHKTALAHENWTQNQQAIDKRKQREINKQISTQIYDLDETYLKTQFFDPLPSDEFNSLDLLLLEPYNTWFNRIINTDLNHYQQNMVQQISFVYNEVSYQRRKDNYLKVYSHLNKIDNILDYNKQASKFLKQLNIISNALKVLEKTSFSKVSTINFDEYGYRRHLYWKNRHKFFDLNELYRIDDNDLYFFLKYHNLTLNREASLVIYQNYLFYKYFNYFNNRVLLVSKNFSLPFNYHDNSMIPVKYKYNRSLFIYIDHSLKAQNTLHLYLNKKKSMPKNLKDKFKHSKRVITPPDIVFDVAMAYHYHVNSTYG